MILWHVNFQFHLKIKKVDKAHFEEQNKIQLILDE